MFVFNENIKSLSQEKRMFINFKNLKQLSFLPLLLLFIHLHLPNVTSFVQKLSVNEKHIRTIESYINPLANPCENFYEYACGNWAKQHDGDHYSETTGLIDHIVNKRLLDFIQEYERTFEPSQKQPLNIYSKVWAYYKSCKRQKKKNYKYYLQLVRPADHMNWPLLDKNQNATIEHFNWLATLAKLTRFAIKGILIDYNILPIAENSTQYIVDLDMPTLDSQSKLPGTVTLAALLNQLGAGSVTQSIRLAFQLQAFEDKIQELLELDDEYDIVQLTVDELHEYLPQLRWRKYLSIALGNRMYNNYTVQVRNWQYFEKLPELINATDPLILCHYLMMKFVYFLALDAASSFTKIDCMVDTRSKMELAINYIYYKHFYQTKESEYNADVYNLLNLLKKEMSRKLDENRLNFNDTEREYLKTKLNGIQMKIGNLPANISKAFVENYYRDVIVSPNRYHHNQLTLLELRFRKQQNYLNRPVAPIKEYFFIADSNSARSSTPYYLMRINTIIVPLGILQPPMFHKNMHEVLKISLFGFLLAHELVHGFDASGVLLDEKGNTNALGGAIVENENFDQALECMQRTNETESIDERIADVVGIRLAYDALFGLQSTVREEQPRFTNITVGRLFFLNLAQFFCGNLQFEFMDHDSDNVRLQQILLNFEPFAEEFKCDLGDTLHPEQTCRLW